MQSTGDGFATVPVSFLRRPECTPRPAFRGRKRNSHALVIRFDFAPTVVSNDPA